MSIYKIVFLAIGCLFLFSCNDSDLDLGINHIDFKSLSVVRKNVTHLNDLGKIVKIVPLETTDSSLIGSVNRVLVGSNGDLYIGDYSSSNKVLHFNKNGRFINSYGTIGEGPGEYLHIDCFSIDSEDNIIILANTKILKFDREGNFIKEKRITFLGNDLTVIDGSIYIHVKRYRSKNIEDKKSTILVLDSNFEIVAGIGSYDKRMAKYLFLTGSAFAGNSTNLYYTSNYNLQVQILDFATKQTNILQFPNNNDKLDPIWNKNNFTEEDRKTIRTEIHRFYTIFCIGGNILLQESWRKGKRYDYWLLNLKKKKITIYNLDQLGKFKWNVLRGVGSFDKGLIGALDFSEPESDFHKMYKRDFPILKDYKVNLEENPSLMFFEFDSGD